MLVLAHDFSPWFLSSEVLGWVPKYPNEAEQCEREGEEGSRVELLTVAARKERQDKEDEGQKQEGRKGRERGEGEDMALNPTWTHLFTLFNSTFTFESTNQVRPWWNQSTHDPIIDQRFHPPPNTAAPGAKPKLSFWGAFQIIIPDLVSSLCLSSLLFPTSFHPV